MGACIHYEFPESQQIYYSVCKEQLQLWKNFQKEDNMFCNFIRAYGEKEAAGYFVYRNLDANGHINAFAVMRCGMIEKVCAHTRTDRRSFRQFCRQLADAQGYNRKKVAA